MQEMNSNNSFVKTNKVFNDYLNNLLGFILVISKEGVIKYASNSIYNVLGYKSEELAGSVAFKLVHPEDLPQTKKEYEELLKNPGKVQNVFLRAIHKDGSVRYIKGIRNNLLNDPEVEGIVLTAQDLTEVTIYQQNIVRNQNLLNNVEEISGVGGWEWDVKTEKVYWTNETYRIHGIEPGEIELGSPEHIKRSIECYGTEDRIRISNAFNDCVTKGIPYDLECRFTSATGKQMLIQTLGKPVFENKNIVKVIGNIIDITLNKREEFLYKARLNLVEFSYKSSLHEFLQNMVDEAEKLTESRIGFYHFVNDDQETLTLQVWSTNTINTMCSAVGKGLHYNISEAGVWVDCFYKKEPVVHNDYKSLTHKKGMPEGHAVVTRELVVPIIRNNNVVAILGVGNKETDYDQLDVSILKKFADFGWDIVERKKAQDNLKESLKLLSLTEEISSSGSWKLNFQTNELIWTDEVYRIFGLTKESFKPSYDQFLFLVHPDDRNKVDEAYTVSVNKSQKSYEIAHRIIKQDTGEVCYVYEKCTHEYGSNGKIIQSIGIVRDITSEKIAEEKFKAKNIELEENTSVLKRARNATLNIIDDLLLEINERKKIEKSLKESEEKYRLIAHNTADNITVLGLDLKIQYVSPSIFQLRGYTVDEAMNQSLEQILTPESLKKVLNIFEKEIAEELNGNVDLNRSMLLELEEYHKNGSIIWVELKASFMRDDSNKPIGIIVITRDITERKYYEERLNETNYMLQLSIEASNLGIWVQDFKENKIFRFGKWAEMLGYSPEEVSDLVDNWKNLIHPEDRQKVEKIIKEHEGGIVPEFKVEHRLLCKSGNYKWILNQGMVTERDNEGKPLKAAGIHLDIDNIKKTQDALYKSEERFQFAAKASNDIIYDWDVTTKEALFSESYIMLFGYSNNTVKFNDWIESIHPEDREKILKYTNDIIDVHGNTWTCEYRIKKSDGTYVYLLDRGYVIRNKDDNPIRLIGSLMDLTERKNAEEELNKYKHHLEELVEERTEKLDIQNIFLRTLIDTIPVPVFVKNYNGLYTDVNPAFEKLFKIRKEDIVNKSAEVLFSEKTVSTINSTDEKLYKKHGLLMGEFEYEFKDGTTIPLLAFKAAFGLPDVEPEGITGIFIDISERKKLEEQTVKAYEREKELNELKTSFISMASHEFRTPLTSILSSSELIEMYFQDSSDERIKKNIKRIQDSVDNMTELLDDVLLISKGEKGKLQFIPLNMNLKILCDNLIEETEHIASRNHKICCNYNLENEFVNADEKLLRLILNNLLSNAVKYSPEGGKITLDVYLNEDIIQFTVTDEGIGISENEIGKIFEPFHRASNAYKIRGTGLGLNIVRLAAELHGGLINVKSEINKGTEIKVSVKNNLN